eukprot:scaffold266671_cov18-Tisochrysis_lutea.AAC.1
MGGGPPEKHMVGSRTTLWATIAVVIRALGTCKWASCRGSARISSLDRCTVRGKEVFSASGFSCHRH